MRHHPFAILPGVLLCGLLTLSGLTARGAEDVEVGAVHFNGVRPPGGGSGNWLEADIALDVHPPGGPASATVGVVRMVSRVRVTLLLGFELPGQAGGERRKEYYRSDVECVALEPGRADVRFYLPPELVRRDQMHGEPKYWAVQLAVGGRPLLPSRAAFAAALTTTEARRTFATQAAAANENDGLLQPQYLTPFATEYPRNTPSFVRRDPR